MGPAHNHKEKSKMPIPNGGGAITPNDSADLATPIHCFEVEVMGDVKVDLVNGDTVTLKDRVPSAQYWYQIKRVYATDTTATGIQGFFEI